MFQSDRPFRTDGLTASETGEWSSQSIADGNVFQAPLANLVPSKRILSVHPEWVNEFLLAGNDSQVCLSIGRPVERRELRQLVDQQQRELTAAGLAAGG